MKRENNISVWQRVSALILAAVMVLGMLPTSAFANTGNDGLNSSGVVTVADPATLTRPELIYGNNTLNAGKVTVGKSVSAWGDTVSGTQVIDGQSVSLTDPDNFLVTISQTAQVMGLTSESKVPVDVVFVLDTSNSMSGDRVRSMVTAANSAIATLMAANENNRIAVVAFSGTGGQGTSGGQAANVLTQLGHFEGDAATDHIQWVTSSGSATGVNRNYIQGRGTNAGRRLGTSSGTNIHAGIALGGKILANVPASDTKVDGITRIPFLVILSDGIPTYGASGTWYDPSLTTQIGPGNDWDARAGLGFLPALTAAYYKGLITEKYFGSSASEDNRCFVYTMGLGLEKGSLAETTVNPSEATGSNADIFASYWNSYVAGNDFNINTHLSSNYKITKATIDATKKYVNGIGYAGGYKYDDGYFTASEAGELNAIFTQLVEEISKKSVNVPTKVTTGDHDFDGYVSFYDPIGEYMEVRDMKGIIAGGHFFQGASAAQHMASGTNADFNAILEDVLVTRMNMTGSPTTGAELLAGAKASPYQAYYNSPSDYNNSIVWWGKGYTVAGEEDPKMQVIGSAWNDSVDYITDSATVIPEGATHVCRSYFYYGTAGGVLADPSYDMLYFIVRVQRSLVAPYNQTVVISAPASLLSVEKVLINESFDADGDPIYTASVTPASAARVVYEVGLRGDINEYNVASILAADAAANPADAVDYIDEITTKTEGGVIKLHYPNYNAETGEFSFYTNDWHRDETEGSHHRAMAHATFDAAADNPFYTYQQDTLLVDAAGNPVTAQPQAGDTVYYVREYYDWTGASANADGSYTATKKTQLISVVIPDDVTLKSADGKWYIPKGTYTNATLVVNGDDTYKASNNTSTATIVAHPHRTGNSANSHYTVLLGNNGKLTMKALTNKTVDVTSNGTTTVDANGKAVMVGDVLTYHVTVYNGEDSVASAVVTDKVPTGTAFVEGSASHGGTYDPVTGVVTWNLTDLAPGSATVVSFQVTVTEAALADAVITIDNRATVDLDNAPAYQTNRVSNPPQGKKAEDASGNPAGDVEVGQVLTYYIEYANDRDAASDVIITDTLPTGTTYEPDSATHGGVYDAATRTITWTLPHVGAGVSGMVSFKVIVDITAVEKVVNQATIRIGTDGTEVLTNPTESKVLTGDLVLTKTVVAPAGLTPADQTFTLTLSEVGSVLGGTALNGTFAVTGSAAVTEVTFVGGVATLPIRDGETITVQGLPSGAIIKVVEAPAPGFTVTYTNDGRAEIDHTVPGAVAVTNTYSVTPVAVNLGANKVLTGTAPVDTVFGFTAAPCDENGNLTGGTILTGEATLAAGTNTASVFFGTATFTAPGTYHYLVSELAGATTGVTYDATQYLVTVTVTDNGYGALVATTALASRPGDTGAFAPVTDGVVFANVYDPLDTSITLEGTKVLTGRDLKAGEFSFIVTEGSSVVATGTNAADGKITFSAIPYTLPGTHTYTVTEIIGSFNGVTYSTASYTVTVAVEDVVGQLVATATYPDGGLVFTNVFTPNDVTVNLEANKTLVNDLGDVLTLVGGEFSFTVTEGGVIVATGNNDATGTVTFSPIVYTVADVGIHEYIITELVPDGLGMDPNMYYDPAQIKVTVEVSYDSATGILSVGAPVYETPAQFRNISNPASVELTLVGSKTTANAPDGVTFSYVVTDSLGNVAATGTSAANGPITFSELSFTAPGTYTYTVSEVGGGTSHAGVTYDNTTYTVTMEVKRDATNKLYIHSVTYNGDAAGSAVFTNHYGAEGHITLTAGKVLTGRMLNAGEFSFVLRASNGDVAASGTNAADGTVTFSTLFFSRDDIPAGQDSVTLTYTMSEIKGSLPGVTYDETVHTVYVKVTDNGDGTLGVQLVDEHGSAMTETGVVFTNTYTTVVGTEATIQGTKTLDGRDLHDGEFTFELYHINALGQEVLVATATNVGNAFSFTRIYAPGTPAGIYNYIVREANTGLHNVSYDTVVFKVQVELVDNLDGTLTATVTYPDGAVAFTNGYTPDDTAVVLEGTKELTGRDLAADEFAFEVVDALGNVVATGTNDAAGKIIFSAINYSVADAGKTFTYTVREVKPTVSADPNLYYDPTTYTVTVAVSYDSATGVLTATATYESLVFRNIQNPASVEFVPQGTKHTANGPDGVTFSFSVVNVDTDHEAGLGVGPDASGNISFSTLSFTAPGTYRYWIVERNGGTTVNGITYDGARYLLEIVVERNATNKLVIVKADYFASATVGSSNAADYTIPASAAAFTNHYGAEGSVSVVAHKTLTGRDLAAGEFSFVITDALGNVVATGTNAADGTVTFSAMFFELADLEGADTKDLTYSMSEVKGSLPGVTYDETVHPITIRLTDNFDGTLSVQLVGGTGSDSGITFSNTYHVVTGTEILIQGHKTLHGRDLQPGEFSFQLYHVNGGETLVATATNTAGGSFQFLRNYSANILDGFGHERTIKYVVRELNNSLHGVAYETDPVWVLVTVTDNLDGTLSTVVKYYADEACTAEITAASFVNVYTPDDVAVNLEVNKALAGRDLVEDEFSFVVKDALGNVVATGDNDATGKVIFSSITYTVADVGTYTYTIHELVPDVGRDPNLYYDPMTVTVTVEVSYDPATGIISTHVTYPADTTFNNIQNPNFVSFAPAGQKTTTGAELPAGLMFSFRVYSMDGLGGHVLEGTGVSEGTDGTNSSVNDIVFTDLVVSDSEFAAADTDHDGYATFVYYIEESNTGATNGVTYDNALYRYTVVIRRNATNALVVSSVGYEKYNAVSGIFESVSQMTFVNDYEAKAHINLTARKELDGTLALAGNAFDFRLQRLDASGKLMAGSAINGSNAADGTVTFATLNYSTEMLTDAYKHDENTWYFSYLLTEIKPATAAIPGVTYDESKYVVTVKVTQTGTDLAAELAGVSHAVYTESTDSYAPGAAVAGFTASGNTNVTFENVYRVTTGAEVVIQGSKTLHGRVLKANEFSFQLFHVTGTEETLVATATNAADGSFRFVRSYSSAVLGGSANTTVKYVIREFNNNLHGVEYDAHPVYVLVTVTDNLDGTMSTEVKYYSDEACATEITTASFVNVYTPDEVVLHLEAEKALTGADLTADAFDFVVQDENGNVVATGTNAADGSVTFSGLVYKVTDAGKTFTYTIRELVPDVGRDPNLYYDPMEIKVTVTVSYDASAGLLTATAAYPADTQFNNIQNPGYVTVKPVGTKNSVNVPTNATFSFTVLDGDGNVVTTGTSASTGQITFGDLIFTEVGTYTFTIRENLGGQTHAGITYDDAVYTMTVVVKRDGYNKLFVDSVTYTDDHGASAAEAVFTNTYGAQGSITVTASKVLEGRDLRAGEFAFRLVGEDGKQVDGIVDASGKITFATLFFSLEDIPAGQDSTTIRYTMTEVIPDYAKLPGVTYDNTVYEVFIRLTDNQDGTLTVELVNGTGTDSGVTFRNTYTTVVGTAATMEGSKHLTGRDIRDGEFSFNLYLVNGGTETLVATATNVGEGFSFTRVYAPGTPAGTYTYIIREANTGLAGVTYDTAAYKVQVTLTDDGYGNLVASVSYPDGTPAFANTYTPDPATVTLEGRKELTGRDLTADEFSFVVTDENGNVVTTGTNTADGKITFGAVTYTVAHVGTHVYTVSEVIPDVALDPNLYYDPITYTVTVTVSYDASTGILTATADHEELVFHNIQNPASVEITPAGTKTTSNAPSAAVFSYSVIDVDSGLVAATGTSLANGAITFGQMSFTEPGTYRYWIVEVGGGKTHAGITYDGSRYLMVVEVTRNATNRLEAQVRYFASAVAGSADAADYTESKTQVSFVNSYGAEGSIVLNANKVLTGNRELKANEFAFVLMDANGNVVATATNGADGKIVFSTLSFDLEDLGGADSLELTYTMREVKGNLPGVTYDATAHEVTLRLTDMEDGSLKVELLGSANGDTGITFTNAYKATTGVSVTMEAQKVLTGRDLHDGEFVFQLLHVLDDNTEVLVATANNAGGLVRFVRNYGADVLDGFGGQRVIRYVIREVNNKLGGVTYDTNPVEITVTVTDNLDGTLSSTVTYNTDTKFENTYDSADTKLKPQGSKNLVGRDLGNDEFSFLVTDQDGNTVSTGLSKADGTIDFTEMAFTAPGTYTYRITEVAGSLKGITRYDDAVFYMVVTVVDNGDGTMTATAKYYSDEACANEAAVVFVNEYTPENLTVHLEAGKTLTGRNMTDGEFSFVILDENGSTVATGGNYGGTVKFSGISISAADLAGQTVKTFTYTMREVNTAQGGVTFDDTVYTVELTVANNQATGKLELTHVVYKLGGNAVEQATFANTYAPASVTVPVRAYKTLVGKTLAEGEFTFELYRVTDTGEELVEQVRNTASGTAAFSDQTFHKDGTYLYKIVEVADSGTGKDKGTYSYDPTVYFLQITVTDDGQGALHAQTRLYTVDGQGVEHEIPTAEFVNYYVPNAITDWELDIPAEKVVLTPDGSGYTLGTFEFQVTNTLGDVVATGTNDENGIITFHPAFTFSAAGWYYFRVTEVVGNAPGVAYDPTVWEVHVLVSYDEAQGTLLVKDEDIHIYQVAQARSVEAEKIVFTNVYTPAPVSTSLNLTKELSGRDLNAGEFTFCLVQHLAQGNLIEVQASNDAEGKVVFDLTYTQAGTYVYELHEHKGETGIGGITYDETVYTVVIVVADDGSGQLKIAAQYVTDAEGNAVSDVTFRNAYDTADVDVTVKALKQLSGGILQADAFTFRLTDAQGVTIAEAKNDADGVVTFPVQTYTLADVLDAPTVDGKRVKTFTYYLSEVAGGLGGVTYDRSVYTVTVTVTDDLKGNLTADVTYAINDGNVPVAIFNNTYATGDGTAVIKGVKEIVGRSLKGGDFTFQVKDEAGQVVAEAKNSADGKIIFPALTYTFDDIVDAPYVDGYRTATFTYTVSEVKGDESGMAYDESIYTITVTVRDGGNGQLITTVAYAKGGETAQTMVFRNVFTPAPVEVTLEGTKELTGRELESGEFVFLVHDEAGQLVTAGKNDAAGKIVFAPFLVSGETELILTITEQKGNDDSIVYDTASFRAKVAVTNVNGQLVATVTYLDGNVAFVNEYKEPDRENPDTGDHTPVVLYGGLMGFSALGMALLALLNRKKPEEI